MKQTKWIRDWVKSNYSARLLFGRRPSRDVESSTISLSMKLQLNDFPLLATRKSGQHESAAENLLIIALTRKQIALRPDESPREQKFFKRLWRLTSSSFCFLPRGMKECCCCFSLHFHERIKFFINIFYIIKCLSWRRRIKWAELRELSEKCQQIQSEATTSLFAAHIDEICVRFKFSSLFTHGFEAEFKFDVHLRASPVSSSAARKREGCALKSCLLSTRIHEHVKVFLGLTQSQTIA